jgi:tetrahydromethanopterin S-methyltransferase subunit G
MQAVREKWTDERLDDLNERVSEGFARVDREIRDLRGEMNVRFDAMDARMDARFRAVNARFEKIDDRFDALHKLLIRAAGGAIGVLVTIGAGLVATQL